MQSVRIILNHVYHVWWGNTKISDQTGKVALVTGANTGIGYRVTEQLALHGAKVYLGARTEKKATAAIARLETDNPSLKGRGLVVWLPLDLTRPADVKKSAENFLAKEERLDILVNNAARLTSDYELGEDGLELSIAINHVGPFILTNTVLGLLTATAAIARTSVRVVTISSDAHLMTPPDTKLNDILAINSTLASSPALNSFAARYGRYCLSKLANVLFASELQRRVSANGVNLVSVSLNPGFVGTDNAISALPAFFQPLMRFLGSTPLQGARAALFAATAEEIDKDQKRYKGKYLNPDGSVALPSVLARNIDLARDLWELTAQAVKNMLGER